MRGLDSPGQCVPTAGAHLAEVDVALVGGGETVRIEAKAVVIATGSSSWDPPVLSGAGDRLLHNDEVFELPELPRSIAVIGTGIIRPTTFFFQTFLSLLSKFSHPF